MLGVQRLGPFMAAGCEDAATAPSVEWPSVVASQGRLRVGETAGGVVDDPAEPEREAWVTLLGVSGLGPVTFGALLAAFGSARAALATARQSNGAELLREAVAGASAGCPPTTRPPARSRSGSLLLEGGRQEAAQEVERSAVEKVPPEADTDGDGQEGRFTLGPDLAARICRAAESPSPTLSRLRELGLRVVTLEEEDYPSRLRRVDMPPPLLFVRGSLECLNPTAAVAIVGTRWPSDRGRITAGWLSGGISRQGAVVVSGMAVGVDGASHAAVVAEGRSTVAVLGGGHGHLFPRAHERLAEAIVDAGGAVVSELTPDTCPNRGTFPRRNRLISGLSDATVVVEAGIRSGALITAGWALEQGRECYLVPGPLDAPESAGCLAFLRSFPGQTRVVCGLPELLEDLGLVGEVVEAGDARRPPSGRAPSANAPSADPRAVVALLVGPERTLADLLLSGPATVDLLAARGGLSTATVLSALTLLELRGLVISAFGRYMVAGPLAAHQGPTAAKPRRFAGPSD